MDELAPGTIRVKHKLISFLPFVIINEGDFDSEMHTLYKESAKEPAASIKEPAIPKQEPEPTLPPESEDKEPEEESEKPLTSKKGAKN